MFSFIFYFLIAYANCAIYMNIRELNREISEAEMRSHLKAERVTELCNHRDAVCASNDTVICTIKYINTEAVYKEFNNSCFLFLANMCDYPGEEFNIVSSSTCKEYLKHRRDGILLKLDKDTKSDSATSKSKTKSTTKPTTLSTLYDIDTAFDYHICPMSCPDTYEPVCVCVNRSFGLYFKFFTFSNHCEADRYYCQHWTEFSPPPGEPEKIQSSPLGWSYCGSSRYLMLTRFSEAAASLGHYGWLEGDYKYSHIMESQEKKPGYG